MSEPANLGEWKTYFSDAIERTRHVTMSGQDRDELSAFVQREAWLILRGPVSTERDSPWRDIGYGN